VNLQRLTQTLGPEVIQGLSERLELAHPRLGGLIQVLLGRSETLWIAFRPGVNLALLDNVVVLEGAFGKLDVSEFETLPRWSLGTDLGAGWRFHEREKPTERSAAAGVYQRREDLIVLVSYAELDSAERSIERGGGREAALEPPERGVVSAAARLRPLARTLESSAPAAARVLAQGNLVEASAELGPSGLTAEIVLYYGDEATAQRAARAAGLLATEFVNQGEYVAILQGLKIEAVGRSAILRLHLDLPTLGALLSRNSGTGPVEPIRDFGDSRKKAAFFAFDPHPLVR